MGTHRTPSKQHKPAKRRAKSASGPTSASPELHASGLPEWQERFCWRYASTLNATRAYMAERSDVQPHSAAVEAHKLLQRPEIRERIAAVKKELCEAVQLEAIDVVREMKRLAFARLSDAVQWGDGVIRITPSPELDDDTLAAVAEVVREDTEFGVRIRVKMHDKTGPLRDLGKITGALVEKVEHSGKVTLEELVAGSYGK